MSYIEILVQRLADHEARSQIVPWASQGRVMIVLGRKKVSDRLTTRPHAELEQNLRLSRSKKTNLVMLKRMARRRSGAFIPLAAKQTFILFIYFRSFLFDSIQQKRSRNKNHGSVEKRFAIQSGARLFPSRFFSMHCTSTDRFLLSNLSNSTTKNEQNQLNEDQVAKSSHGLM